ncbi:hypothetical protein FHG66_20745 [Rubellimicrobium rubrum]|uniref:Uncharacterized protein n=1 Tax=Rubellimicrobium rubrum TaxID=2585369 RepID=A0A5C4MJ08_9RHOB|nr:hypothetical protein [Rubellimicrobium rubrum]TNC44164.1 hypothetical protein FHG66_20745 [Rubellimicrobium rubrum]
MNLSGQDRRAPKASPWAERSDLVAKRDLIESAGGRFCAVTFVKKDGTERRMQVQPAALRHRLKGDAASEAAKRATFTRQERHPHLLPVWDVRARAPRSINLRTVSRIAVDGGVHSFPA